MKHARKIMVYTCTACQKVFEVPWFQGNEYTPPEMLTVIEHEEAHTENGETPGWELVIIEKEEDTDDTRCPEPTKG